MGLTLELELCAQLNQLTMKRLSFFLMACLCLLTAGMMGQGSTSSSMSGKVIDQETKEGLVATDVIVTHIPSGTVYGVSTDLEGFFRIPGMRVGGPYKVEISYVGYEAFVNEGIYLTLGQNYKVDAMLSTSSVGLEEVLVTADGLFDGNKTGAETVINEEQINTLPTVSRSIGDFTRLTPQSRTSEGNDGFELSFAGQNNRYNSIYIDGAVSNDVFGLAGSGTNGGQTGVSPISLDAIEQFQVNLAPFDVRQGGFGGAAINAITRSGNNNVEGSAYYFFRNQSLAGKTPTDNPDVERERLNDFTAQTFGARIGGPIIPNKLFYFANVEFQRDETPLPFDFADYRGDSDAATITQLENKLRDQYGYDPGTFTDNERFLNSEKYTLRLDYNLNQKNKLSFKASHVHADNLEGVQSNPFNLRFLNSSEAFDSRTTTLSAELNTIFNQNLSNNLTVGFTAVRDDRDPSGSDFPYVLIEDGSAEITFGSERFSTANLLNQNILTITNNLQLYKGNHTFTFGTHNEFYQMDNLFIAFNYGSYEFGSLETFLNDGNSDFFIRNYSLVDNLSGDESAAIASFNAGQVGLYFQDEIQVNDNFKFTAGLRLDLPFYDDTPQNDTFNINTIPLLEAEGYDLMGAEVGRFIEPQLQISPRIGFNWDIKGDNRSQLRGGAGIFTSRAPLVWAGGAFNNYGQNVGTALRFGDLPFNPDPFGQVPGDINPDEAPQSGSVDLFAADFKLPQFLKLNLALDQKLGNYYTLQLDGLFNKTIQNVAYQNLNLKRATSFLTGTPDDRPIFDRRDEVDPTYSRILLAYNTNKGYAYNLSANLIANYPNNWYASAAYSYGDSYSVFDGTSSQNSSQWRGLHTIRGRNYDQQLTRSDFSAGHRFIAGLSKRFEYSDKAATTITLFHEVQQGRPFSYIYNDGGNLNNEDSRERALIYIPESRDEIILIDDGDLSADAQWNLLNAYIENDSYLSKNRGEYAERNSSRQPWTNVMDLKLIQDFTVEAGGKDHTLQLTLDIFNFTNLLNKDWGRRYFVGSFGNFELLDFEGYEDGTNNPTYTFNPNRLESTLQGPDGLIDDNGIQSSRWQMQLGIRYIFN